MIETTNAPNRGAAPVADLTPVRTQSELLPAASTTPSALLHMAMSQGADLDRLERLMQMQLQWEANEARKAYFEAFAAFKEDPPAILKTKRVYFEPRNGGAPTDYFHSTHSDVTMPIARALAEHGISHRWIPEQKDGYVFVTCVLTHRLGYSESTMLFASPDNTGNKNGVQAIVSTKTYLERHTLLAATGLSTADMPDDDGRGADDPQQGHQPQSNGNANQHQKPAGSQQAGAPDSGVRYVDDDAFKERLPSLQKSLNKGKPVEDLILFVESNGAHLTDAQKKTLRDYQPAVPA